MQLDSIPIIIVYKNYDRKINFKVFQQVYFYKYIWKMWGPVKLNWTTQTDSNNSLNTSFNGEGYDQ